MVQNQVKSAQIERRRRALNVCLRPEADIANVNVSLKPPHLGASCAYLEDVTAAEFCEEGGHGLEVGEAEALTDFHKFRLVQCGVRKHIEL